MPKQEMNHREDEKLEEPVEELKAKLEWEIDSMSNKELNIALSENEETLKRLEEEISSLTRRLDEKRKTRDRCFENEKIINAKLKKEQK